MSIICKMDDGKNIIFSKGAPDFLFDSCKYYLDKNGDIKPIDDDFNSVFLANLK
jgi:magnesium-transporting ATPase (P-type)